VSAPNANADLDAISCSDAQHCIAVAGVPTNGPPVAATSDGGSTWSAQSANSASADLSSVSCPSITLCWAVGAGTRGGLILHTLTGGEPWPDVTGLAPSQGSYQTGAEVTITGAGFFGNPTVTLTMPFGTELAAEVSVVSPSQLQVNVPPCNCALSAGGELQATVTVTDPGIGTAMYNSFTYLGPPLPPTSGVGSGTSNR
jgi:IPT/TIG domain